MREKNRHLKRRNLSFGMTIPAAKSKKKVLLRKKIHAFPIFRETFSAFYDFLNAFYRNLFGVCINLCDKNIIKQ
jgi:hypothetical protein